MNIRISQEKLSALMSHKEPVGVEWTVAAHVIDGVLDNDDLHGAGFRDWTPQLAVETYADENFLEREEIDADDIEWDDVLAAVGEALRVLQLPTGVTLVESESVAVYACGADLDAAKADFVRQLGEHRFEPVTGAAFNRLIVVSGPMPDGGWEAMDAERVLALGEIEGHLLARPVEREAA